MRLQFPRQPALSSNALVSRPVVWLIGFFAFLNVYSMQSVLPLLMRDFSASPVEAGATVGATVLAVALVSPFIGMLSDALGRKWIICGSLLLLTVPTALISIADSLQAVVLLRFAQGLFIPGIVVVLMAYIAEELRFDAVARMSGVYIGGAVMGGFSGRFITGHAGNLLGWRGAFVTLAVLNLLGSTVVLLGLPRSRQFAPNRALGGAFRVLGEHLRNPRLLAASAVGFCVLFSLVGTFTYVNLLLNAPPFNLSAAGLANVFCVYLVGVVVTPLSGRFIVRFGFRHALLYALASSCAGMLLTLPASLVSVVAGLALCSSGVFICQSVTISFIADSIQRGRSLANGVYYLAYYAGGAAGSIFVGLAFEQWHWGGAVLAIVLVQISAAVIGMGAWHGGDSSDQDRSDKRAASTRDAQ